MEHISDILARVGVILDLFPAYTWKNWRKWKFFHVIECQKSFNIKLWRNIVFRKFSVTDHFPVVIHTVDTVWLIQYEPYELTTVHWNKASQAGLHCWLHSKIYPTELVIIFFIFHLNWWVYLILILSLSQVGVLRTDRWTWWHLKCLSLTSESNPSNRVKSKGLIRYLEICMDYTVWHIHCITLNHCCPISR